MTISEKIFLIIFFIFLVVNNGNLENSSKWKKMANKTWEMGIVFHPSTFAEVLEPSTAHLIIFKYLTNHQFFPRKSLPISHSFPTQTSPACLDSSMSSNGRKLDSRAWHISCHGWLRSSNAVRRVLTQASSFNSNNWKLIHLVSSTDQAMLLIGLRVYVIICLCSRKDQDVDSDRIREYAINQFLLQRASTSRG